MQQDPKCSCNN